jgi:hypothetical protein
MVLFSYRRGAGEIAITQANSSCLSIALRERLSFLVDCSLLSTEKGPETTVSMLYTDHLAIFGIPKPHLTCRRFPAMSHYHIYFSAISENP